MLIAPTILIVKMIPLNVAFIIIMIIDLRGLLGFGFFIYLLFKYIYMFQIFIFGTETGH